MSGLTIEQLLAASWSWQGPKEVREDDRTHFELRVAELPDFLVAGETREEVLQEAAPALRAFLLSFVEREETPPLPERRAWVFFTGQQRPPAVTVASYQALAQVPA